MSRAAVLDISRPRFRAPPYIVRCPYIVRLSYPLLFSLGALLRWHFAFGYCRFLAVRISKFLVISVNELMRSLTAYGVQVFEGQCEGPYHPCSSLFDLQRSFPLIIYLIASPTRARTERKRVKGTGNVTVP